MKHHLNESIRMKAFNRETFLKHVAPAFEIMSRHDVMKEQEGAPEIGSCPAPGQERVTASSSCSRPCCGIERLTQGCSTLPWHVCRVTRRAVIAPASSLINTFHAIHQHLVACARRCCARAASHCLMLMTHQRLQYAGPGLRKGNLLVAVAVVAVAAADAGDAVLPAPKDLGLGS